MNAVDKILVDFIFDSVSSSQNRRHVIELSVVRVGSLNQQFPHVLRSVAVRREASPPLGCCGGKANLWSTWTATMSSCRTCVWYLLPLMKSRRLDSSTPQHSRLTMRHNGGLSFRFPLVQKLAHVLNDPPRKWRAWGSRRPLQ